MIDVQELESIYDLPQDAAYYISYGKTLEAAVDSFRARYFYYPETVYKIRGNTSLLYFQVEKWDDVKDFPKCPRCGSRLLNDGGIFSPIGLEGETWRCEHCDYSIDIVDE
jgi:hypothetical protein